MIVVHNLDDLGRIVVPVDIRHALGIAKGDAVEIFCDGADVAIAKYTPSKECIFCKDETPLPLHKGKSICERCRKELALVQGGDEG